MVTTIQIDEEVKEKLDNLKIHHRESYNGLIQRLVENFSDRRSVNSSEEFDKESLLATIEVLSDPELMKEIKEGLEEEGRGDKGTSFDELKKELDT